jgi:hypothetical protein
VTVQTLAISVFGLVVTIGLVTYNARNDQLYDELVGRAASIERNLGIPDGAFANRPNDWLRVTLPMQLPANLAERLPGGLNKHFRERVWKVNHRVAVATIYYASIALWLAGGLAALGELGRKAYVGLDFPSSGGIESSYWINLIAVALAIPITARGARLVRAAKKSRQGQMRVAAATAVDMAENKPLAELVNNEKFLAVCEELCDTDSETLAARIRYLTGLTPDSMQKVIAPDSGDMAAAQLVATITDLSPGWLFDCRYSRRLTVEFQSKTTDDGANTAPTAGRASASPEAS